MLWTVPWDSEDYNVSSGPRRQNSQHMYTSGLFMAGSRDLGLASHFASLKESMISHTIKGHWNEHVVI